MIRFGVPAGVDLASLRLACRRELGIAGRGSERMTYAAALAVLESRLDVAEDPLGWCLRRRFSLALLALFAAWGASLVAVRI